MNEYGAKVEWYWQGKTEVLGQNTIHHFVQIPHKEAWDRTQASPLKDWWPTAWHMARPAFLSHVIQQTSTSSKIRVFCPQSSRQLYRNCSAIITAVKFLQSAINVSVTAQLSHRPCYKWQLNHTTVISISTQKCIVLCQVTATFVPSDLPYCHQI
jgi:hypothetical protein